MTIKKRLSGWVTAAMALGAVNVNAFGNTKALKAPRRPNIPKTTDDYEAMHKAEMKRRRKAEKAARNSNTI